MIVVLSCLSVRFGVMLPLYTAVERHPLKERETEHSFLIRDCCTNENLRGYRGGGRRERKGDLLANTAS